MVLVALGGCDQVFGLDRPDDLSCPTSYVAIAGSSYRRELAMATWGAAELACEQDLDPALNGYTHLVVFSSNAELKVVTGTLSVTGYWLGSSDLAAENEYRPVTGEATTWPPLETPPWASGQPNNLNGHQNCVWVDDTGQLDDKSCDEPHVSVCECDGFAPGALP
jgi:lectin-like protein